jgi:hypothetical protein
LCAGAALEAWALDVGVDPENAIVDPSSAATIRSSVAIFRRRGVRRGARYDRAPLAALTAATAQAAHM